MSVRLVALIQCDVCGDEPDWKYPPEVPWDRFPLVGTSTPAEIAAKSIGMLKAKGWLFNENVIVGQVICPNCPRP